MAYTVPSLNGKVRTFLDPVKPGLVRAADGGLAFIKQVGSNLLDIETGEVYDYGSALLSEAQMIGRNVSVLNIRSGSRQSFLLGNGDVAENTVDTIVKNNLHLFGVCGSAENIVDSDLKAWPTFFSSTTEPETGVYRVTHNGGPNKYAFYDIFDQLNNRYGKMQARLISGTVTAGTVATFTDASFVNVGTAFDLSAVGSDWTDVDFTVTDSDASGFATIRTPATTNTAFVMEFRYIRCFELSTFPLAAFAYDTSAGAVYGTDLLYCSPTVGTEGTIVYWCDSYGFTNATMAGYDFGTLSFLSYLLDNDQGTRQLGLYAGGGPETTTFTVEQGEAFVRADSWDGTKVYVKKNKETQQEFTNSGAPTGTMYLGNRDSGALPWDGILGPYLIFNRKLSESEIDILVDKLTANIGTEVFFDA